MIPSRDTFKAASKDLVIAVVVTLALIIYMGHVATGTGNNIRRDINQFGRFACQQSVQQNAVGRYNQLVRALISDYQKRKAENIERQDYPKALINEQTISALKVALIPVGPAPDCSQPLLP